MTTSPFDRLGVGPAPAAPRAPAAYEPVPPDSFRDHLRVSRAPLTQPQPRSTADSSAVSPSPRADDSPPSQPPEDDTQHDVAAQDGDHPAEESDVGVAAAPNSEEKFDSTDAARRGEEGKPATTKAGTAQQKPTPGGQVGPAEGAAAPAAEQLAAAEAAPADDAQTPVSVANGNEADKKGAPPSSSLELAAGARSSGPLHAPSQAKGESNQAGQAFAEQQSGKAAAEASADDAAAHAIVAGGAPQKEEGKSAQRSRSRSDKSDKSDKQASGIRDPDAAAAQAQRLSSAESAAAIKAPVAPPPAELVDGNRPDTPEKPSDSASAAPTPPARDAPRDRFASLHAHGTANSSGQARPLTDSQQFRLVQRVARAFDVARRRGESTIRLRLSPPQLGSLRLEVQMDRGALTARLEVETIAARDALVDNAAALRQRLSEQGIRVEQFDVDLMDRSSSGSADARGQQSARQNRDEPPSPSTAGAAAQGSDSPDAPAAPSRPVETDGILDVII